MVAIEAKRDIGDEIIEVFETKLKPHINSRYQTRKDCRLMIYLGAYLNDSIYKQLKYLKTKGLLKQIASQMNAISKERIHGFTNACHIVQSHVATKNRIKISPLRDIVRSAFQDITPADWDSSQEDLLLALIIGYNHYSEAIRDVFSGVDANDGDTENGGLELPDQLGEQPSKEVPADRGLKGNSNRILTKTRFRDNVDFHLGLHLGLYYFITTRQQAQIFKTTGLVKHLYPFIRDPDAEAIKHLLHEIIYTSLNLFSVKKFNELVRVNKVNGSLQVLTWLPCSQQIVAIFDILATHGTSFDEDLVLLGFSAGYNLVNDRHEGMPLEPVLDEAKANGSTADEPDKVPRFITEAEFFAHFKAKEVLGDEDELPYLLGVVFCRIKYEEENRTKTHGLIKDVSFIFRNMEGMRLIHCYVAMLRSYFAIWIYNMIHDHHSIPIYSGIQERIISILGDSNPSIIDARSAIAFMTGYDAFGDIFKEKSPTKQTELVESEGGEAEVDDDASEAE